MQMVHERRTKKRNDPIASDSSDEEEIVAPRRQRGVVNKGTRSKLARSASGRGRGKTPATGTSSQGDLPPLPPLDGWRKYDIHMPHLVVHNSLPVRTVDYKKRRTDVYNLRREDPYEFEKHPHLVEEVRFWNLFQAHWYESVVCEKANPIIKMQYVDWEYMANENNPIFTEVMEFCKLKNLYHIMSLQQGWNKEIVAQFCATAWFSGAGDETILHFSIEGHRFQCSFTELAEILGFDYTDLDRRQLANEAVPSTDDMHIMYDERYPNVQYGTTHGMSPFFKILNSLFRVTLTPKVGDKTSILGTSRVLLMAMLRSEAPFSVFRFIWTELMFVLHHGSKSIIYAPYIMRMVEAVTGMTFVHDSPHTPYRVQPVDPPASPSGGSPIGASHGISHSSHSASGAADDFHISTRARPSGSRKRSSLLKGLKALFTMCQNTNDVVRQHVSESRERIERLERKLELEPQPWRELPPVPPTDNPWAWYDEPSGDAPAGGNDDDDSAGDEE